MTPYPPQTYATLASRGSRLGAILLDCLVLLPVNGAVFVLIVDWDRLLHPQPGDPPFAANQLPAQFICSVIAFLYVWLMTATRGQTLGKKWLGIRVVNGDTGYALTWGQAAGREGFRYFLGFLCFCVGLLDPLWILWDQRNQCLHDKVIRSVVVNVNPGDTDPYASRR